jgi:type II secretory pathway pseudopilin PulG
MKITMFEKNKSTESLAFTVLELLVVMGIIAIVVALLFPLFANAKRATKTSKCIDNLHEISLATGIYGADNQDRMPFAPDPATKQAESIPAIVFGDSRDALAKILPAINELLSIYHLPKDIWECPLDENILFGTEPNQKGSNFLQSGSSYDYDDWHALKGWAFVDFAFPEKSPIIQDVSPWHGPMDEVGTIGTLRNVAFADMHVKSVRPIDAPQIRP